MKKIMGIFLVSLLLVVPTILCMNNSASNISIIGWWTTAGASAGASLGAGVGIISAYSSLKDSIRVPCLNDLQKLRKSIITSTGNAIVGSVITPILIIGGLAAAGAIGGNAVGLIGQCASHGGKTLGNDLNENGIGGWGGAFLTGVAGASVASLAIYSSH